MTVSYSTVIATRNRPNALALSLPLLLGQSRRPDRIVVVDSSDDVTANRTLIGNLSQHTPIPIEHILSAAGSSLQRNIGIRRVTSDVTFFPDDDSLVYPEALEKMLRIYDLDTLGRIGGVCGLEVARPPSGVMPCIAASSTRQSNWLRKRLTRMRLALERDQFPDPMKLAARRLYDDMPAPERWLEAENAVRVEWMTGFRMSFRTDAIREFGFNEALGPYALYEDVDAGLRVLSRGKSLVAALDAHIYHDRAPERRTDGRQFGVINILNRSYVAMRSGVADENLKSAIRRYAWFRTMQFRASSDGNFGRDRYLGAQAAQKVLNGLLSSRPENLEEVYLALRDVCIANDDQLTAQD